MGELESETISAEVYGNSGSIFKFSVNSAGQMIGSNAGVACFLPDLFVR